MAELLSSRYTVSEEIAHALTHGLGIVLSIIGLVVMVVYSALNGGILHIASTSVYGASMILLYSTSTLYHAIPLPAAKKILRQCDHAAIYVLIAGTYTPFMLVSLQDSWGWTLLGVIWFIAIVGIVMEFVQQKRFKRLSLFLYLGLGWIVIVAINPMIEHVGTDGMLLLLLGGLSYSFGVIFYVWHKLAYNHAIWHVFVLAGSVFHYFSIFFYVVP
jgi:hemolysin III